MDCKFVTLLALLATFACCNANVIKPCACGRVYFPVCSTDNVTSNNYCEFECRQNAMLKYGKHIGIKKEGPCNE